MRKEFDVAVDNTLALPRQDEFMEERSKPVLAFARKPDRKAQVFLAILPCQVFENRVVDALRYANAEEFHVVANRWRTNAK
jgi:hypothetical protein